MMKVKADKIPETVDYLTAGKEYDFTPNENCKLGSGIIKDDNNENILILTKAPCSHLDEGSWEIIE